MRYRWPGADRRTGAMRRSPAALARALRRDLRSVADVRKAPGMQAYMRSRMPFLGTNAPDVRTVTGRWRRAIEFDDDRDWAATVRFLWAVARFREERYAVIDLTGAPSASAFQTPRALPLYGHLIQDGAWWDYVDELAIRRVGPILRAFPSPTTRVVRRWSRGPDLWKRRASIICQVGSKQATDVQLLSDYILPSLDSREFFLRKGIGWALRQHARVDPGWVRRFVAAQGDRLSPLSRREALRHLGGDPDARPRRRPRAAV